jgi:hypothetical protein
MSEKTVYVLRFASWAPGLNSPADWEDWTRGQKEIETSGESPTLAFAESPWLKLSPKEFALFKRRQSQISRMTIHVLHEIMPIAENVKMIFVSFRGEVTQQFKINKMLIEEGDLGPAAFSQSVFNTPPALAAIALGLRQGYSAVYPGNGCFNTGFQAAVAPLISGRAEEIVFVYADELCPAEYGGLCPEPNKPLAFAVLLSARLLSANASKTRGFHITPNSENLNSPENFLKFLYQNKDAL